MIVVSVFISIFIISFLSLPGAEAAGLEAHEDGADELAKGGCVDRIQFLFLTVAQVVVVQGAPGQAHSFCSLIVIQQPLQLKIHREHSLTISQS